MLAEELRHEGFDVCEAEGADHAIALIHQPPKALTLLITDIHMPGSRNGLHVASEIRAWHPQIPIIYATARPDALNGTVRPGAKDALLAKPFTPSDLMAVVRQLLNRNGVPDENITLKMTVTLHAEAIERRELPAWIVFRDGPECSGKVIARWPPIRRWPTC
jgi:DNA-binding response OmpR family regulator